MSKKENVGMSILHLVIYLNLVINLLKFDNMAHLFGPPHISADGLGPHVCAVFFIFLALVMGRTKKELRFLIHDPSKTHDQLL